MITHGTTPRDVLNQIEEHDGETAVDGVGITKDGDTVTVEYVNREEDGDGLATEAAVIAGYFMGANTRAAQQGRAGFQKGEYWAEHLRVRVRTPNTPDANDAVEYGLTAEELRTTEDTHEVLELIADELDEEVEV
jgi:hypothetical protein